MESTARIYLGIDPAGNHKPFRYVALDEDCRLLVIGEGRLEDMLSYLAGQSAALVAVNGTAVRLAAGEQESLFPDVPAGGPQRVRRADIELEQMGIHPASGTDGKKASPRTRNAAQLYSYLEQLGYQTFPAEGLRQVLETNCEAAFTGLIGKRPYDGRTLEGRMQRQMVLFQQGLPLYNPMDFFEEVTPRKLAHGLLPLDKISPPGELDAWLAAYTAWLAGKHPERVKCLGVPEEGQIYLPVAK